MKSGKKIERVNLFAQIPAKTHERAKAAARRLDVPLRKVVEMALDKFVLDGKPGRARGGADGTA